VVTNPGKEVKPICRWEAPTVLARGLARVRERPGVPVARQLRLAVVESLDQHEVADALRAPRPAPVTTTRGGDDR
jgi:hypothetical protein